LPTETVLGLFCVSGKPGARQKLFEFKGRNPEKKLAYYVHSAEQIEGILGFKAPHLEALAKNFLPGPLTLIYEKNGETLGFRIPERESLREIIKHLGEPLLGTSLNQAGKAPCLSRDEFQASFGEKCLDVAIQIEPDKSIKPSYIPSTVALIREKEIKILREGSISLAEISQAVGLD